MTVEVRPTWDPTGTLRVSADRGRRELVAKVGDDERQRRVDRDRERLPDGLPAAVTRLDRERARPHVVGVPVMSAEATPNERVIDSPAGSRPRTTRYSTGSFPLAPRENSDAL
jgi:hypothetical protein